MKTHDLELKDQVESILKLVEKLFSPEDVAVHEYIHPIRYLIIFYFNDIDDKYITNPNHPDLKTHKANMFRNQIRRYIQDYLDIKTTGLQPPDYHAPVQHYPITVMTAYVQ